MPDILDAAVFFVCSLISSMGLGGGGLLIIYLTSVMNLEQLYAQGTNLFFFLPCCVTSLTVYIKRRYIKPGLVVPMLTGGVAGVLAGRAVLQNISSQFLKNSFAVFLIVSGLMAVFSKKQKDENGIVSKK